MAVLKNRPFTRIKPDLSQSGGSLLRSASKNIVVLVHLAGKIKRICVHRSARLSLLHETTTYTEKARQVYRHVAKISLIASPDVPMRIGRAEKREGAGRSPETPLNAISNSDWNFDPNARASPLGERLSRQ